MNRPFGQHRICRFVFGRLILTSTEMQNFETDVMRSCLPDYRGGQTDVAIGFFGLAEIHLDKTLVESQTLKKSRRSSVEGMNVTK